MKGYLDLVRAVMAWEPRAFILGGVAEDTLLHGCLTRPHGDLDVLVPREELEWRVEQGRALGFSDFYVRMEAREGLPLVVGAVEGDLNLEFIVIDRDDAGASYFDIPTPTGTNRVWLPADTFAREPTLLANVPARTVSPLALYQVRLGALETFGGFRPKDHLAQAALRERFFAGVPEERLAPRIERIAWEDEAAVAAG